MLHDPDLLADLMNPHIIHWILNLLVTEGSEFKTRYTQTGKLFNQTIHTRWSRQTCLRHGRINSKNGDSMCFTVSDTASCFLICVIAVLNLQKQQSDPELTVSSKTIETTHRLTNGKMYTEKLERSCRHFLQQQPILYSYRYFPQPDRLCMLSFLYCLFFPQTF